MYISGRPKSGTTFSGYNFKTAHNVLRYHSNRSIAQLSSCGESNAKQIGLSQKDLQTVVVFLSQWL